jgi:hypothetical protein
MKTPAANLSLRRTAAGSLVLTDASGVEHANVIPVRLFPLTDPTHWISLTDAGGQELACVKDVDSLPDEDRTILLDAVARRDFVPVIQVIHSIRRAVHGYEWFVTTNRGDTNFCVEDDESVESLGGGNIVVIDEGNTRYRIPSVAALDAKSRQRFERYY